MLLLKQCRKYLSAAGAHHKDCRALLAKVVYRNIDTKCSYFCDETDRMDVNQNKRVSEVEMSEGLFLLCGAQLAPEGFRQFANSGCDDANCCISGDGISKEQFRRVINCFVDRLLPCMRKLTRNLYCVPAPRPGTL